MSHQRRIDRLNPALFILLVDQSDSMAEPMHGGVSKMQSVTTQVNRLIHELVLRCAAGPGNEPRPYFSLAVVGYGSTPEGVPLVEDRLPGAAPGKIRVVTSTEVARSEIATGADTRGAVSSGQPRPAGQSEPLGCGPRWILPRASGGTPTCHALDHAGRLAHAWVREHPHAFPPIVVHLTDGESTDGNPREWARRLRSLRTSDGPVLLFNLRLAGSSGATALFPADAEEVANDAARELFQMSSTLPDSMIQAARSQGLQVAPGARGFAWNSDSVALAQFLSVGTRIGRTLR